VGGLKVGSPSGQKLPTHKGNEIFYNYKFLPGIQELHFWGLSISLKTFLNKYKEENNKYLRGLVAFIQRNPYGNFSLKYIYLNLVFWLDNFASILAYTFIKEYIKSLSFSSNLWTACRMHLLKWPGIQKNLNFLTSNWSKFF
jgi:hypothetical protein